MRLIQAAAVVAVQANQPWNRDDHQDDEDDTSDAHGSDTAQTEQEGDR